MRMVTRRPPRISAACSWRPARRDQAEAGHAAVHLDRVAVLGGGSGEGPAGTAPRAISRARSLTDRWERTVLSRVPPIRTWIRSQSAQIRAVIPARWVPIQNCRFVTHMFPDGGTTRSNSTGPPFHCAGLAGGRAGRRHRAGRAWRDRLRPGGGCALQGRREPQADQVPLLGGHRGEPLGRGDRHLLIQCLVRPVGVVLPDPGIDRGLRLGHRGERASHVEEVRAEGAVEALHLPVLVR